MMTKSYLDQRLQVLQQLHCSLTTSNFKEEDTEKFCIRIPMPPMQRVDQLLLTTTEQPDEQPPLYEIWKLKRGFVAPIISDCCDRNPLRIFAEKSCSVTARNHGKYLSSLVYRPPGGGWWWRTDPVNLYLVKELATLWQILDEDTFHGFNYGGVHDNSCEDSDKRFICTIGNTGSRAPRDPRAWFRFTATSPLFLENGFPVALFFVGLHFSYFGQGQVQLVKVEEPPLLNELVDYSLKDCPRTTAVSLSSKDVKYPLDLAEMLDKFIEETERSLHDPYYNKVS